MPTSSPPPTPDNAYTIAAGTVADRALFQAIFTSIHNRLVTAEAGAADYEAATDLILSQALAIVSATLDQEIAAGRAELADITEAFEELQAGGFQATRIQTHLDGVNARNVQAMIEYLAAQITIALTSQIGADRIADGAVTRTEFAATVYSSQAEALAGTATDGIMTPFRVAQEIGALAGDVVKEIYSASVTFTKQADDIGYWVECYGGGGSGAKGNGSLIASGGLPGEKTFGFIAAVDVPSSLLMTIGAGGAAATALGSGNPGSPTTFGDLMRAAGGIGGLTDNSSGIAFNYGILGQYAGFAGGSGTVLGLTGLRGARSTGGSSSVNLAANLVDMPTAGGCFGGGEVRTPATAMGTNGQGGAATGTTGSAASGSAPGGGGGAKGDNTSGNSGAGARGEIRVYRFKRRKA